MSAEVLAVHQRKDLLRLLTCGSVDDGKSTLIGRLLYDSTQIYDDHLRSLKTDSKRVGSAGDAIDFSLLLDGLKAERQQGITIDVAYRYFSTPRRKFIIADCPGHVQYTRNMVTGGSTANLAVVLVDAQSGVLEQTRRHSFLVSLLDIGHIVVAINKMDLVDYGEDVFERIREDYTSFATRLAVRNLQFIPISALRGDNVVEPSQNMPWFQGTPLLRYLETVHIASDRNLIDLRFPVQHVLRPDHTFRGYCGTVASGVIRPGAEIMVLPSRHKSRVRSIETYDGRLDEAFAPQAVTLTIDDDIDISRGDMLVYPRNVPRTESELEAILVWMSEAPLCRERPYLIKHCTSEARAEIAAIRYRFDVNTLHREDTDELALNEIGRVHLRLSRAISFDPYARNHATGSFILIDPATNNTVGAGMILDRITEADGRDTPGSDALEISTTRRSSEVSLAQRAERLGQRPATVWLTGLPSSGKSTTAFALEKKLFDDGHTARVLDGEALRLGISGGLGFGALERSESVRRAAHVARLLNDTGVIAIVALVSPYAIDRAEARQIIGADRFIEVHVSAPVEVCEARDDSGLYQRAKKAEIGRFTGVSAPYEAPAMPEVELPTHAIDVDEAVRRLVASLGRFLD